MSIQTILAASQSMARMQTMQSARVQMQGNANVLRAESKQDGGDEKKDAKADALEEKSSVLMSDMMTEASDVNETLKPDEDITTEETSNKNAAQKPKEDTVELSASAQHQVSSAAGEKPVVGEAVTYKADGSATPSEPVKSKGTFKATA